MPNLKFKNDDTNPGKPLRVQFWNGKLPTYDSLQQRAAVQRAETFGTDGAGNPVPDNNNNPALQVGTTAGSPVPNETAQAQAQAGEDLREANADGVKTEKFLKGLSKADLEAHAEATEGVTIEEGDTKAVLIEKILAAQPQNDAGAVQPASANLPQTTSGDPALSKFDFTPANLLQETVLMPGEEKVFSISAGMFITIKED